MIDTATRALLSLGCFVGVGAALMVPLTDAGSGERIVSLLALLLGAGIVVGSVAVRLLASRPLAPRRDRDDATPTSHDDPVVTPKENP
ncbi:hypothetical protein [Brachybacterium saurashtrense]|uniref:Uncharacterized protein n=1 Tax=Brachybacterium saurashtrense TaxID=556288 RepID=A0A345YQZ1_9MICO|nr:hypothetical protein [Brachybacterium saurashtrense]AXK46343.1 hypothetical protein DWV08_12465 [Brachybacterium saurashtrense]RRR24083.1 hypothetical protein DXU92_04215 [Brachybacterium saurashtrense]